MKILISGATGTLGSELCKQSNLKSHQVFAIGRDQKKLESFKQNKIIEDYIISDGANVQPIDDDVQTLTDKYGSMDTFIHCAGVGSKGFRSSIETVGAIGNALSVNAEWFFQIAKTLLGLKKPIKKVIVISSRRGSLYRSWSPDYDNAGCSYAYRIAKAALNMCTLSLAEEHKETTFNIVHPGKLISRMGVVDAFLTPELSAQRILSEFVEQDKPLDFYSTEDDSVTNIQW